MRVFLLLGLLALCASAFAVQDDAALQPNFATEGDDDSFLEALSANMNINEDLDNEINALDDVKSADELKDKATEIADKLAEMKAELDEEEARVHKRGREQPKKVAEQPPTNGSPTEPKKDQPPTNGSPTEPKKEQPKKEQPKKEQPNKEQQQKRKKDFTDPDCGWQKVGDNHFMKTFEQVKGRAKSKARTVIVNAEGQFVRAFANKDKATAWVNAEANKAVTTPPAGWTAQGHTLVKTEGDAVLVRINYACFQAHKFAKKEDADAFIKKADEAYKPYLAKDKHCKECPDFNKDTEQQQQKEQQTAQAAPGSPPPTDKQQATTGGGGGGVPASPDNKQQATTGGVPAPPQQQAKDGKGAFDDAMNDEEDQPQQQQQPAPQQQQQQPAQQQQQQPAPQQQQQQDKSSQKSQKKDKSAQSKQQQQQDKSTQKSQKNDKVQKKDDKANQKKDDKAQKKDDKANQKEQKKEQKKEQQQDKATVEARVAKLKKHGFEEVEIGNQNFLFGVVHYTTGAGQQKVKTVVTNDKGNYVREFNKEREAEWLQKKLEKKVATLTFPPKGYDVSEARKFLTRAVEKKTYIRGNFYPFSLVHCKNNDKLEQCVAAKKQQLQEKADKLDKEEHKDVETPEEVNNEAQTDETVEAEEVPKVTPQENDEAEDM